VVGEVLGKFHPHGDTAVYDALVRLAQTHSTKHVLISGHGNFGSVDNDPPAAMRYTECKLSPLSHATLLDGLEEDTVDFVPNFDGNEMEPKVLPAKLPILLLNGCAGIAVGMATNVPPHNLGELMDACVALVSKDDLTDKELLRLVPGPDFPTGGSMMGVEGAESMYLTGRGGVKLRSVSHTEQVKAGKTKTRTAIVVTELPYQVNKAALIEKIAELTNEKKIEGIADLRDESDRDGIRMVIELKRDAVVPVVLSNLYKKTGLQTTFSGNFLALMGDGSKPMRFTLRQALDYFLEFRFLTLRRQSAYQFQKVQSRAHIVDGLLLALESADEVIATIRSAKDQSAARTTLTSPPLSFSDKQADAVLKLQLGQLTRLNKGKLSDERKTLQTSIDRLATLLNVDDAIKKLMIREFKEMKKKYSEPRKTEILSDETGEVDEQDMIPNSRSVIVITKNNYMKRMPLITFSNQKRGTRGKKGTSSLKTSLATLPSATDVAFSLTCNDHDTLLITTTLGVCYALPTFKIPEGGRTTKGVPVPTVLPLKKGDAITSLLPVGQFSKKEYCVLATEQGWIKKTPIDAFQKVTSRGLKIATLEKSDKLKWCEKCTDDDDILIGTSNGVAARFKASKLRPTGRSSRGVNSIRLKEGDKIADMSVLKSSPQKNEFVLAITNNGYGKRVCTEEFQARNRSGAGVIAMKFKETDNASESDQVNCLRVVSQDDEILMVTSKGIIVRQKVGDIPTQRRTATGVRVQKVDTQKGDYISSVSIVPQFDESIE